MIDFTMLPFTADHALAITDIESEGKAQEIIRSRQYLETIQKSGPGFTLLVEGRVAGSVVFINLWPGLAEVVMFISSAAIGKYPRLMFGLCRENLDRLQTENKWRRLQAKVRASSEKNIMFAQHLGFEIESAMEAYGPEGETFLEMVRIRKELGNDPSTEQFL